jgi:hypothetical protein
MIRFSYIELKKGEIMKLKSLCLTALLAMAACSSDENSGSDLECYTKFTDETAKLFYSYKGFSLDETATHRFDDGEYSSVVKKYTYTNAADAEKKCAALKAVWSSPEGNHYECEDKVVIERYVRLDTREEIRENDEYICNYLYQLDKNGTLDSLYKANGGM